MFPFFVSIEVSNFMSSNEAPGKFTKIRASIFEIFSKFILKAYAELILSNEKSIVGSTIQIAGPLNVAVTEKVIWFPSSGFKMK